MPQVPIACTLTADAAVDRLGEWRDFLTTKVETVDYGKNSAILTLRGGNLALMTATDLAEREKACCSFFEFSLALGATETSLTIGVPPDAEPILTEFLALLPPHLRPH